MVATTTTAQGTLSVASGIARTFHVAARRFFFFYQDAARPPGATLVWPKATIDGTLLGCHSTRSLVSTSTRSSYQTSRSLHGTDETSRTQAQAKETRDNTSSNARTDTACSVLSSVCTLHDVSSAAVLAAFSNLIVHGPRHGAFFFC